MDWLAVVDVDRALVNVLNDVYGDWYRDPWTWPELSYVVENTDLLARRLEGSRTRRVAKIEVAKENFATRPAVIMDPVDRLMYQALVDTVSKGLIGGLSHAVHGWRLVVDEPQTGRYARNDKEWERHRKRLKTLVALYDYGLKTDVVSCFASVPIDRLSEDVERRAGTGEVTRRLLDMLSSWNDVPGRGGLPQRSAASAVLANMYLSRVDRVLDAYSAETKLWSIFEHLGGSLCARWMDDIWAFGSDEARLRSLQVDVQDALRDAGLNMNLAKTDVLEGDDLAAEALRVEHSAVDEALAADEPDVAPLEELIDSIVAAPLTSDRTSIHFALKRLRQERLNGRIEPLVAVAPKMPHGADHLARVFRDFGTWVDLQDWFVDYVDGPWSRIEWSVAQFGTMFPTKLRKKSATISPALRECFLKLLTGRHSLPVFALAAQRLAAWEPDVTREAIRALLPDAEHPLERRIVGLVALALGEERRFVRSVLSEYEENTITLSLIEARDYKPLKLAPDFTADKAP